MSVTRLPAGPIKFSNITWLDYKHDQLGSQMLLVKLSGGPKIF